MMFKLSNCIYIAKYNIYQLHKRKKGEINYINNACACAPAKFQPYSRIIPSSRQHVKLLIIIFFRLFKLFTMLY